MYALPSKKYKEKIPYDHLSRNKKTQNKFEDSFVIFSLIFTSDARPYGSWEAESRTVIQIMITIPDVHQNKHLV